MSKISNDEIEDDTSEFDIKEQIRVDKNLVNKTDIITKVKLMEYLSNNLKVNSNTINNCIKNINVD